MSQFGIIKLYRTPQPTTASRNIEVRLNCTKRARSLKISMASADEKDTKQRIRRRIVRNKVGNPATLHWLAYNVRLYNSTGILIVSSGVRDKCVHGKGGSGASAFRAQSRVTHFLGTDKPKTQVWNVNNKNGTSTWITRSCSKTQPHRLRDVDKHAHRRQCVDRLPVGDIVCR